MSSVLRPPEPRRRLSRLRIVSLPQPRSVDPAVARRLRSDANHNSKPHDHPHLATGDWIRKGSPWCLIESQVAPGRRFRQSVTKEILRAKYLLTTQLVNELVETDEKMLAGSIAQLDGLDLLCIEELGYMGWTLVDSPRNTYKQLTD